MARERDFGAQVRYQNLVKENYLCVGLDPHPDLLMPRLAETGLHIPHHASQADIIAQFNEEVIDATKGLVAGYKPNSAFFEALGRDGYSALRQTILAAQKSDPDVFVIDDAKRGDIGSTNELYAQAIFDGLDADAVTIQPYVGQEGIQPFLNRKNKGAIVLARTSNDGRKEFQDLRVRLFEGEVYNLTNGPATPKDKLLKPPVGIERVKGSDEYEAPLYVVVAHRVVNHWNINGNAALVAGATSPHEAGVIRDVAGAEVFMLLPGFGAQNGEIKDVIPVALRRGELGVANISRAISFPKLREGEKYFDGVHRTAEEFVSQLKEAQAA